MVGVDTSLLFAIAREALKLVGTGAVSGFSASNSCPPSPQPLACPALDIQCVTTSELERALAGISCAAACEPPASPEVAGWAFGLAGFVLGVGVSLVGARCCKHRPVRRSTTRVIKQYGMAGIER